MDSKDRARKMSSTIQVSLSISILVLFFIVIGVGYVYVDEGRKNIDTMNTTLTKFIGQWNDKQAIDNIRFNQTLNGLANTYKLIVDNQHIILKSANDTLANQASSKIQRNNDSKKLDRIFVILNSTK